MEKIRQTRPVPSNTAATCQCGHQHLKYGKSELKYAVSAKQTSDFEDLVKKNVQYLIDYKFK